ncbi:hypothetical protein KUTeg_010217 [Tegillarca granosa]|uniref:Beta-glucosidase n=1 Tax=Tegillarca granosa TaxID=220873 RepID=A0ABQ9F645_TEGGR|nr:hypothetical protein KUTeg_010217 [Tegillarca granosa]
MSHQGRIKNNDTGDKATDSYHLYMRDIEMLKELKVTSYRFSLSWTRILPDGSTNKINREGIDYYNKVIDALLKAGHRTTSYHITILIYLFHYIEMVVGKTGQQICFQEFGDRVKTWFTINEPSVPATKPLETSETGGEYIKTRNLILAHAGAYRIYEQEFKAKQMGKVSIVLNAVWMEPKNSNIPDDVTAATRAMEFTLGLFANPIYKNGDFPEIVKQQVTNRSIGNSRLPIFSSEERKMIKGELYFDELFENTYFLNEY